MSLVDFKPNDSYRIAVSKNHEPSIDHAIMICWCEEHCLGIYSHGPYNLHTYPVYSFWFDDMQDYTGFMLTWGLT